jgi:hypothetical protein
MGLTWAEQSMFDNENKIGKMLEINVYDNLLRNDEIDHAKKRLRELSHDRNPEVKKAALAVLQRRGWQKSWWQFWV